MDRFCLLAEIKTLQAMMEEDATALCGPAHRRNPGRIGYRWGTTAGEIRYHGANIPR